MTLYPFLFVLYAALAPLTGNLDQISPVLAIRPLVVLLLAAAAGLLILYAFLRDWKYAAYLVFLVFAFFFTFGHIIHLAQDRLSILDERRNVLIFLVMWFVILLILGNKRVWAALGGRARMVSFLNLVLLIGLVQPIYRLAVELPRMKPLPAAASAGSPLPKPDRPGELELNCKSTPDIYYIVLDGYSRADVLEGLYGVDNRPFVEYLKSKGFFVAEASHTNYTQTIFSIPAALNFNYIDIPTGNQEDSQYFLQRIRENALMRALKSCGYQIAVLKSGYYYTDQLSADLYLTGNNLLNEFESLLLADTPADVLAEEFEIELPTASYDAHRQRVLDGFNLLRRAHEVEGPKFVFAHLIIPHPPFVFDKDGDHIHANRSYSMNDGDEFGGTLEEYREGYAGQLQFSNRMLEQVIDSLLANSTTQPVIIVQGDHGAGSRLDWDKPERTCLWERSSILNAYYLPDDANGQLYPSISPVNSFRVVLNSLFDTELALLPDRTYFTSHLLERQAIDITATRDSQQNCAR